MISGCDPACAERDGRGRVAFGRFGDDILLRKTLEQIANSFFLFDVGENENALIWNEPVQSRDCFFEQSALGNEAERRCPLLFSGGHHGFIRSPAPRAAG